MRGWFFWSLVALIFAVVGHLSYVLFGPEYWMKNKLSAVLSQQDTSRFVVLDPAKMAELLPAEDPGLVLAICKINLEKGPVKISVAPIQQFWSLSIYSAKGDSFYTINDRQVLGNRLEIKVSAPAEGDPEIGALKTEKDKAFVDAPTKKGWAVVRLASPSWRVRTATAERAKAFSCKAEGN